MLLRGDSRGGRSDEVVLKVTGAERRVRSHVTLWSVTHGNVRSGETSSCVIGKAWGKGKGIREVRVGRDVSWPVSSFRMRRAGRWVWVSWTVGDD